ncbi:hypothetical protein [Caballeronia zhejiangensis]|nr:hypothetical protein [Caballeronia zhejiangensis]
MNVRGLAGIVHHHTLDELERVNVLGAVIGAVGGALFVVGFLATLAAYLG